MKIRIKKLNSVGVAHHALIAIVLIAGFAGFGAWRVFSSHAANAYTFTKPNGCKPGKLKDKKNNCNWMNQADKLQADCAEYHVQFDGSKKQCVYNCVSGWFVAPEGYCKQLQEESVLPKCQAKHLVYDKTTNKCLDKCVDGYHKAGGDCVKDGSGGGSGGGGGQSGGGSGGGGDTTAAQKKECADKHRVWNDTNKQCSERCVAGYSKTDGKLPCKKDAVPATQTDQCAAEPARCAAETGDDNGDLSDPGSTEDPGTTGDDTTNGDGVSEQGGCIGGARVTADGTCPESDTIAQTQAALVSTIDPGIKQDNCELMGREWESSAKDNSKKNDKKAKKLSGCKVDTCLRKESKIVNQSNGKPFCTGFVAKIDKSKCNSLHRKWLDQVRGCAVRYNQKPKPGATVVKAKECAGSYTTYVYKTDQSDECLQPSNVQKLKGIAKATGTPFVKLTNMSKAGICKIRPGVHWNGSRCVPDKPAQTQSSSGTSQGGGSGNVCMSSSNEAACVKCYTSGGTWSMASNKCISGGSNNSSPAPTICQKNPDSMGCSNHSTPSTSTTPTICQKNPDAQGCANHSSGTSTPSIDCSLPQNALNIACI